MINNKLKEIRMKEFMMNQKDFAQMLGISPGQYNRYEKLISIPTLEIALRIADQLNRDVKQIFSLIN